MSKISDFVRTDYNRASTEALSVLRQSVHSINNLVKDKQADGEDRILAAEKIRQLQRAIQELL